MSNKKKEKQLTPGEMLAKIVKGDKSFDENDLQQRMKKFFNDRGVNCEITITNKKST